MKGLFVKGFVLLGFVFLILFFGRWFYLYHLSQSTSFSMPQGEYPESVDATSTNSYTATDGQGFVNFGVADLMEKSREGRVMGSLGVVGHNYAKEAVIYKSLPPQPQAMGKALKPQAQEETYEKIGSLASWTRDFESDEKKIRSTLDSNKVLIQQEQNSGLKGDRLLNLALGVVPEKFDPVIEEIRKVGNLVSFKVTKTAKTNDYKALMAQRASLEKDKADLVALKSRGGKMSELLDLQERIFKIEQSIGDLGLSIGQFEGPTSLCTVLVTLKEMGPAPAIWVFAAGAFHWTVGEFFGLLFFLLFAFLSVLVGAWAVEKTKKLPETLHAKLKGSSRK
jgi:hypothetical protein